jgi:hypothetical protein
MLSVALNLETVLGVNVVDKALEQTACNLDPVRLASSDTVDIIDGPDVTLQL